MFLSLLKKIFMGLKFVRVFFEIIYWILNLIQRKFHRNFDAFKFSSSKKFKFRPFSRTSRSFPPIPTFPSSRFAPKKCLGLFADLISFLKPLSLPRCNDSFASCKMWKKLEKKTSIYLFSWFFFRKRFLLNTNLP